MDNPTKIFQLQIGQLEKINREALLPYETTRAIVILHDVVAQNLSMELSEGLVLQLLTKHPLGQARVILYEAQPGFQFALLKQLLAKTEQYFGEQLFTQRDFNQLLTQLNELAHRRFTLLATANVSDISQYNALSKRSETTHYLILNGLELYQLEVTQLQILQILCQQGSRVGIVPVLLIGANETEAADTFKHRYKLQQEFLQQVSAAAFGFDLQQQSIIPINQAAAIWSLLQKFQLTVKAEPAWRSQWQSQLIDAWQQRQQSNTESDFLQILIGMDGAQPAYFCLGEAANAYHALLAGANRSGKSTLLNNLILSACERYSPDELRLWLFDYREGVEFSVYQGLAHVDALHIDHADQRYAIEAFAQFEALIEQRAQLFRQANVTRLLDYNRVAKQPLPRCLLIVDEAQSLFEDREAKIHAKRMLRTIARKGASFGLHLLLSTQSYQNVDLDADVKGQFRLRVALQLATSMDCRALMGNDNDAPLHLERFWAVYNNNNGLVKDNRIIALDELPRAEFVERLAALKQRYPQRQAPAFTPSPAEAIKSEAQSVDNDEWAAWDSM